MKVKESVFIILVILTLAFIIRFWNLEGNPSSLYGDELTMVLDVYSLLETGRDQTGQPSPLTFSMGAGRPAGYVYSSLPFVGLFGPTALGIRLLSVLSGLLIVFLLYLLGRRLFSERVGILSAFLLAISPWDISLSRGGFEAHYALALALVGVVSFLYATTHRYLILISALSFGLAIHTYPTYKLTLPLFIAVLVWFIGWKNLVSEKSWRATSFSLIVLIGFGILAAAQTLDGGSETRFTQINILANTNLKEEITQKVNHEREVSTLPDPVRTWFSNKALEYLGVLTTNFLANFSSDFLFVKGDGNPRHNMASTGQLYPIEIITISMGLLSAFALRKKQFLVIVFWLAIAALPAAIIGPPHALRSSFILPGLVLISALGAVWMVQEFTRFRFVLLGLSLILVFQVVIYLHKIYFISPGLYSRFWSSPAKIASEIAVENKNNYDFIILSDKVDNLEYAYPVYARINPVEIISQNRERSKLNGLSFKRFENVYIGRIPDSQVEDFLTQLGGRSLFIGIPEDKTELSNFEIISGKDKMEVLVIGQR